MKIRILEETNNYAEIEIQEPVSIFEMQDIRNKIGLHVIGHTGGGNWVAEKLVPGRPVRPSSKPGEWLSW